MTQSINHNDNRIYTKVSQNAFMLCNLLVTMTVEDLLKKIWKKKTKKKKTTTKKKVAKFANLQICELYAVIYQVHNGKELLL